MKTLYYVPYSMKPYRVLDFCMCGSHVEMRVETGLLGKFLVQCSKCDRKSTKYDKPHDAMIEWNVRMRKAKLKRKKQNEN